MFASMVWFMGLLHSHPTIYFRMQYDMIICIFWGGLDNNIQKENKSIMW